MNCGVHEASAQLRPGPLGPCGTFNQQASLSSFFFNLDVDLTMSASAVALRGRAQTVTAQLSEARRGISELRRQISERYLGSTDIALVLKEVSDGETDETIDSDRASRKELAVACNAARRKVKCLAAELEASQTTIATHDHVLSTLDLKCAWLSEQVRAAKRSGFVAEKPRRPTPTAPSGEVTATIAIAEASDDGDDADVAIDSDDADDGGGAAARRAPREVAAVVGEPDIDEEALVRAIWQTQMANKVGLVSSRSFATPAKVPATPASSGSSYLEAGRALARSWFPVGQ